MTKLFSIELNLLKFLISDKIVSDKILTLSGSLVSRSCSKEENLEQVKGKPFHSKFD